MTQAARKLTFEEYVNLEAEDWVKLGLPEGRHEYIDGELVEVPSESELNNSIANFLFFVLASSGLMPFRLIHPHSCEIEVSFGQTSHSLPRLSHPQRRTPKSHSETVAHYARNAITSTSG